MELLFSILQQEAGLVPALGKEFGPLVEVLRVVEDFQDEVLLLQTQRTVSLAFSVCWCSCQDFPSDVRVVAEASVPYILR